MYRWRVVGGSSSCRLYLLIWDGDFALSFFRFIYRDIQKKKKSFRTFMNTVLFKDYYSDNKTKRNLEGTYRSEITFPRPHFLLITKTLLKCDIFKKFRVTFFLPCPTDYQHWSFYVRIRIYGSTNCKK